MTKEIPLTKGYVALVDDDVYDILSQWKWQIDAYGYAIRTPARPAKTTIKMHRAIMNAPQGIDVDHTNGNKLDNRLENLRLCTRGQGICNRPKYSGTYSSQFKGVSFKKNRAKPWRATITANGNAHYLGSFQSESEAAQAYDRAVVHYHGDFAQPNFPDTADRDALLNTDLADETALNILRATAPVAEIKWDEPRKAA